MVSRWTKCKCTVSTYVAFHHCPHLEKKLAGLWLSNRAQFGVTAVFSLLWHRHSRNSLKVTECISN